MIKTVMFGLKNVLVGYRSTVISNYLFWKENSEKNFRDILKLPEYEKFERGEILAGDFWKTATEKLYLDISFDDFIKIWNNIFIDENLFLSFILEDLQRANINLAILANTNQLHWEKISEMSIINQYFKPDNLVLSFFTGYLKPEKEIFEIAIDGNGCNRFSEVLLIDSNYENIVKFTEGKNRGYGLFYEYPIIPVRFLREQLKTFGLLS